MPFGDEWRWAGTIVRLDAGKLGWADFWRPQYEHRILFPTLAAVALSRLGGWDTVRESYFALACAVATQVLFYRLVRNTLPAAFVLPAFLAGSLLLFSLGQVDNWLWGFQLAWFVVDLGLFVVLLALSRPKLDAPAVLLAIAGAALAIFSLAFGLGVAPAGLVLLAARRPLPVRALLVWSAVCALFAGLYAWGLPRHALPPGDAVRAPSLRDAFVFGCVLLGAPLANWTNSLWALSLTGLAALVASLAALTGFVRDRLGAREVEADAPWIALVAFGLLGVASVVAGRAGYGPAAATATRYVTLTSLVWIGLVAWGCRRLAEASAGPLARRAAGALAAAGCAALVLENAAAFPIFKADSEALREQQATVREIGRVPDDVLLAKLFTPFEAEHMDWLAFPAVREVPAILRALERSRQGPFRGDRF